MDFLSPAGWLFLEEFPFLRQHGQQSHPPWPTQLRLVLWAVLCEFPEAVNLMGPECGSWGVPARGTSLRTMINAFGALHLPFVSNADMTVSRSHGLQVQLHLSIFI